MNLKNVMTSVNLICFYQKLKTRMDLKKWLSCKSFWKLNVFTQYWFDGQVEVETAAVYWFSLKKFNINSLCTGGVWTNYISKICFFSFRWYFCEGVFCSDTSLYLPNGKRGPVLLHLHIHHGYGVTNVIDYIAPMLGS